jgi:hypothetical protein
MVSRYLQAMVDHDWAQVCAIYTPALAAQQSFPGAVGCQAALAGSSGFLPDGSRLAGPNIHPEWTNQRLTQARVTSIVMLDGRAQVHMDLGFKEGGPVMLLAVRDGSTWRLAQALGNSIPIMVPVA